MPFRDERGPQATATDPFLRFSELFAAFENERGFFGDRAPLRLAAASLVTMSGTPAELATRVRARAAELGEHYGGWTSSIAEAVRLVLAATLVRTGESVGDFVAANERVQARMKAAKVRSSGVHGLLAAMILRRVVGGEPDDRHIERMRAIYERMKHHHWFLTGPEDLSACAMLIAREGTPEAIGDHVEAIYQRLADAPKVWGGDELQTAANVLGLIALAPDEAATRFLAIADALRARGVKVRGAEYDEVAVLSFLPRSAEQIAERVAAMRGRIQDALSWYEDAMGTSLAVNLAFLELVQADHDARVGALADAKLLLDMQTIVTMRQAAMGAATIAATS